MILRVRFDSIPIDDIYNKLCWLCTNYDMNSVMSLETFNLKNTELRENYIQVNNEIFNQVLGVAQRAQFSNIVANIYLFIMKRTMSVHVI